VIEIGEYASFFAEFEVMSDLERPSVGVELLNERSIVIHGKNSVQFGARTSSNALSGSIIRTRHRLRLDVTPGHYTFNLGVASVPCEALDRRGLMTYQDLAAQMRVALVLADAGQLTVIPRRTGQALPFHGLCDLDGSQVVTVVPGPRAGAPADPAAVDDDVTRSGSLPVSQPSGETA
jgi:lipopolysaccharide transport system ATP-binding protein